MKITDFVNKKFVIYTFFLYIIKKVFNGKSYNNDKRELI